MKELRWPALVSSRTAFFHSLLLRGGESYYAQQLVPVFLILSSLMSVSYNHCWLLSDSVVGDKRLCCGDDLLETSKNETVERVKINVTFLLNNLSLGLTI